MPLQGKQILPRDFAAACAAVWPGDELPKAVATGLGESNLYVGAYNDNLSSDGKTVSSRDCGILEINISAASIGQPIEFKYRTTSKDVAVYQPIIANSVEAASALYHETWTRNGEPDIRRWQPWFAYTEGWSTLGASWIWHQVAGKPTGPWLKTGRYIHRAIAGCANYHLLIKKDKSLAEALAYAETQWERFSVDGSPHANVKADIITFSSPGEPGHPPKDGIGPRPIVNDGL